MKPKPMKKGDETSSPNSGLGLWRLLALTMLACLAWPSPSAGQMYGTIYSGNSVGSNFTVYGWGVTDMTSPAMYHTASVWDYT